MRRTLRKNIRIFFRLSSRADRWRELWEELKSVIVYWIEQGVRIFRVDNPHTKPFPFWEWLIKEIGTEHPDVIFLAEAFARPKVMLRLAKLGFTQSYNYFPWRNTKSEITQYFTELTQTEVREFLPTQTSGPIHRTSSRNSSSTEDGRPSCLGSCWRRRSEPVTAFMGRRLNWESTFHGKPGSEEYLHSEKYEIKHWDLIERTVSANSSAM